MDTITDHLDLIAAVGALTSLILHAVAPRTKTKKDDTAVRWLDKALGWLPKMRKPTAPSERAKEVTGFGEARDHRK